MSGCTSNLFCFSSTFDFRRHCQSTSSFAVSLYLTKVTFLFFTSLGYLHLLLTFFFVWVVFFDFLLDRFGFSVASLFLLVAGLPGIVL